MNYQMDPLYEDLLEQTTQPFMYPYMGVDFNSVSVLTQYPEKINWNKINNDDYYISNAEPLYKRVNASMLSSHDPIQDSSNIHIRDINWVFVCESNCMNHEKSSYYFIVSSATMNEMKWDPKKRNWNYLSLHIKCMTKLDFSLDKYQICHVNRNAIFYTEKRIDYDYDSIRSRMNVIKEELIATR